MTVQTPPLGETLAQTVQRQYRRGLAYNAGIRLPQTVQQCEDFYTGNQWKGCEAQDLDKPVMNILKRVVSYFLSSIAGDDIGISLQTVDDPDRNRAVTAMLQTELMRVMESAGVKRLFRTLLRNAAVDGDGCIHFWFEPGAPAHGPQNAPVAPTPGQIRAEMVENYNLFFADPHDPDLERQRYLIIRCRRPVAQVRTAAQEAGAAGWEGIGPDNDPLAVNADEEQGRATVLAKYFKRGGTVWYCEVCGDCVLRPPVNTGYRRYPLVWLPWERVKNRAHGQSAIQSLIPNQIFINKLYAMAMRHVMMCAFPKIAYNRAMLPGGWSNRVGEAIPVNGAPDQAIGQGLRVPDMSDQVLQLINRVMADTRDTMGASDASLGNVRPDNTSAIVAIQKATAQPLELQKMDFYDAVEACVRIWLEMMRCNYGARYVAFGQGPVAETRLFDFAALEGLDLKLQVEVGAAGYYSELMQAQTLDRLYANGIITDPLVYLECMPNGYIKDKARLMRSLTQNRPQPTEQKE